MTEYTYREVVPQDGDTIEVPANARHLEIVNRGHYIAVAWMEKAGESVL